MAKIARSQISASVIEVVLRQLMEKAGRGHLFQGLAGEMSSRLGSPLSRALLDGFTVIGGTLGKLGPLKSLLAPIFSRAGFDPDESLQLAGSVFAAVGEGLPEGMSEGLDEAEIRKRAAAEFDKITGVGGVHHGLFTKLTTDPSKAARATEVYVINIGTEDAPRYEFHPIDCPHCQPEQQRRRKKGDVKVEERPRAKKTTLGFALDNAYAPTQKDCCRKSVDRLIAATRRTMKLEEIAARLPAGSLERDAYDGVLDNLALLTEAQRREFERIRGIDAWQETDLSLLQRMIRASIQVDPAGIHVNITTLLDRLHGKIPPVQTMRETVREAVQTGNELRETVEEIFGNVAESLRRKNEQRQRQIRMRRAVRGRR